MTNLNAVLNERLKTSSNSTKMAAMARQSASGNLTTFAGMFSLAELTSSEKERLQAILQNYNSEEQPLENDLHQLIALTSEVKAINNQAALLHGERIKKAHQILIRYREGAFTAWLMAAYGNRQTPYNLMQYFDFCEAMPKELRARIEEMPRPAIYALASREGDLRKKQEIIEGYLGESKQELLNRIRTIFPLATKDKRRKNENKEFIERLSLLCKDYKTLLPSFSTHEKKEIANLLQKLQTLRLEVE